MSTPKSAPSRRSFLLTCGSIGAATLAAASCSRSTISTRAPQLPNQPNLKLAQRTSRALGSDISMIVLHEDLPTANRALDAAFAALARVENVMSIYLPDSQLSQLNKNSILPNPDPWLLQILQASHDMAEKSDGAFDITVQPLWTLYAAAQKSNQLPSNEQIAATRKLVDWRALSLSPSQIRLNPGMAITLNGIAQGFAADRAMDALKSQGIQHALVNTGEIASLGSKSPSKPWTVGIQHPRQPDAYLGLAKISGRCISTSGDYQTAFTADKTYNHIFDPHTGRSPLIFSSVTVVAPNATLADALTKPLFIFGLEKGLDFARQFPNVDILLVTKQGRQFATKNFPWNA